MLLTQLCNKVCTYLPIYMKLGNYSDSLSSREGRKIVILVNLHDPANSRATANR